MPDSTGRRGRDPLVAIFDGHCCWPECEASTGEIDAPLCMRHVLKAWRAVNASGLARIAHMPRTPPPPPEGSSVYFIRFGDRIKIGYTTNLRQRLADLPHDELLHAEPGTMRDEKRCHAAFAHLRETGEWFRAEPDLLAFIDDLRIAPTRRL